MAGEVRSFRPLAGKWLGKVPGYEDAVMSPYYCFRPLAGKWLGKDPLA